MTEIISLISGVSNEVYENIIKAKFRDPSRSVNPLDFFDLSGREALCFDVFGDKNYEAWLESGRFPKLWRYTARRVKARKHLNWLQSYADRYDQSQD